VTVRDSAEDDQSARDDWRTAAHNPLVIAGGAVLGVAIVLLAIAGGSGALTSPKAIVLGAVEGITEYLPVSSTGHLLITQRLLNLGSGADKVAADTYAIAIQIGAILAVIALYRRRLWQLVLGLFGRDEIGRRLLIRLVVAFVPAATIGAALNHTIKNHLFGPWPVVGAWAVGGAFLLLWKPGLFADRTRAITDISVRGAAIIGFAQALALWPGVSRSLVTIVAALALGCTMSAALEFSFLLGLATLTAATIFDLYKDGGTLIDDYGWRTPLLGGLIAFVTAMVAVRWLVAYLRTRPLSTFGWYRLGIAAVTVLLIWHGSV
jgi:undecaprenyl-diphosphatase